jgi:hypothetical protein
MDLYDEQRNSSMREKPMEVNSRNFIGALKCSMNLERGGLTFA